MIIPKEIKARARHIHSPKVELALWEMFDFPLSYHLHLLPKNL